MLCWNWLQTCGHSSVQNKYDCVIHKVDMTAYVIRSVILMKSFEVHVHQMNKTVLDCLILVVKVMHEIESVLFAHVKLLLFLPVPGNCRERIH